MTHIWHELNPTSGKKQIAIHEMADGFLVSAIWNWREENIHQQIMFFMPLDQARDFAEQILTHIGQMNLRNRGASHPYKLGPPSSPDTPFR